MKNFIKRLNEAQRLLASFNCECFIIEDPIDIFYLSGIELSRGILMIHQEGACLFVDGRYLEKCKESAPFAVYSEESFDEWLCDSLKFILRVHFDGDKTSYSRYTYWQKKLAAIASKSACQGAIELIAIDSPIKTLRRTKDQEELILLRKAAQLGSQGYDFIVDQLKEGITEAELAIELEIFWKRKGAKGLSFEPIIAFGKASSMPHYRPKSAKLACGDIVLIDIGVNVDHYHSDMTRTLFFGAPDNSLKEIYQVVKEAQAKALQLCKPNTPIMALDRAARQHIAEKGYGPYFVHSLGHGIGLEIHEAPFIRQANTSDLLQEGMVITIEPGIYVPKLGGVRLEDTIAITKEGYENLTKRPIIDP